MRIFGRGVLLLAACLLAAQPGFARAAEEPPLPTPDAAAEAAWRTSRDAELTRLLARNGSFSSEEEIEKAVAHMAIDPDKPMIALTYDDGPKAGVTDRVLDTLEKYNARATFFVNGVRLHNSPACCELARRATALGCEIGNHTWAHESLPTIKNYNTLKTCIERTNEIVEAETGYRIRCLRPPGGACSGEGTRVAKRLGLAVTLWSQSGNVHARSADEVVTNVQKQIVNGRELRDGDIVLLHDTQDIVADATEQLVPMLLDAGYQLVTVSELLHYSGGGPVAGKVYRNG